MSLARVVEEMARRALRRGLRRRSSGYVALGGLLWVAARVGWQRPRVVYREELPVGSTVTISHRDA